MSAILPFVLSGQGSYWICRLCLRTTDGDNSSWSHLDRILRIASLKITLSLRTIINTLRHTQAYNDTTLPQNVCEACVDATVRCLLFWHQCEQSERKWTRLTNNLYRSTRAAKNQLINTTTSEGTRYPVYILIKGECKELILSSKTVNVKNVCKFLNRKQSKITEDLKLECDYDLANHIFDSDAYSTKITKKNIYKRRKYKNTRKRTSDIFTCKHCPQSFIQKRYLITHLRLKHNIFQKVECNDCGRKFNSISLLRRHVISHRTPDVYKCSSCENIFNLASELESHFIDSHHEKRFQCPECPEIFYRLAEAKKHQMNIHDSGHENVCKICGKKYTSLARLLNHEEKHKGIVCDKCGKKFAYPYKLRIHIEKCTSKNISKSSEIINSAATEIDAEYLCERCNKKFVSEARLKRHLDRHLGVVCEKCGRRFKYKSQLKTHTNLCLRERKPGNPRPTRQNSGSPHFICDHCGREFNFKERLKTHIRSQHLFHHIYKCDFCDKKFSYKGGLKSHLVVHTRERPEQCNICGRCFVTKPALIYHMRLHTGERPFACELCDEKFLSASRRMAHIRKKHWGRTEECSVCSSKFYTPYAMRKHMSRHFNPNSKLFCNKATPHP